MSRSEQFLAFAERSTDWLNPILLKETRQALKSRQFILTFFLLLIVAWTISVGGVLWAGPALEYGTAGRTFFVFYFCVLAFAIFFVVPFGAFRSMLNEQEYNTYELMSISTLSPRQIVWGKLGSAVVQILIYYSAIAPFVAFTSLLQGFDLALVVLFLTVGVFWSVCVTMLAIMFSTLLGQKQWQATNTLGMIVMLMLQLAGIIAVSVDVVRGVVRYDRWAFWIDLAVACVAAATYFWLSLHVAVSRLTFESDNRSTWIRIICSVQFWSACAYLLMHHWNRGWVVDNSVTTFVASACLFHWVVVGTFAASESEFLSRRIRRTLPDSALARWLKVVWIPGGSRGLVYVVLHLAMFSLLIAVTTTSFELLWIQAAILYVVCYLGFGAFLGRLAHTTTPEFRPAHTRALMLLMAAFAVVAPLVVQATGIAGQAGRYSLLKISNPFETLPYMADGAKPEDSVLILVLLGIAASVAVVVNGRAAVRGVFGLVPYRPASASERVEPT